MMNKGVRRQGRELALKMIYSLTEQEGPIERILDEFWRNFHFQDDALGEAHEDDAAHPPFEVRQFAEELTRGVFENHVKLDEIIRSFSTNWALERMARVDLALLRMTTFELLFCPQVPANVAINEAIEVGKRYGTKETPAFINGVLDKIARVHRPSAS
jgi:transcription antitermination protein NusB